MQSGLGFFYFPSLHTFPQALKLQGKLVSSIVCKCYFHEAILHFMYYKLIRKLLTISIFKTYQTVIFIWKG